MRKDIKKCENLAIWASDRKVFYQELQQKYPSVKDFFNVLIDKMDELIDKTAKLREHLLGL